MATPQTRSGPLNRLRLLAHSLASVIDQAGLSALNLALGLILIRWATKDDYGLYAQLFVACLFAISLLESVIINPLTTLAPRLEASQRARLIVHLSRFQQRLTALLSAVLGTIAWLVLSYFEIAQALAIAAAFAAYVAGASLREFQRGLAFIQGRPGLVLRTDGAYGVVVLLGMVSLVAAQQLTLPLVLWVLALGNALAWLWTPTQPRQGPDPAGYRAAIASVWARGRLGLPGALSSWAVNYSYLYLAAAWLGVAAAADLNAARLLLMPVGLLVVAWSRVARPQMSHLLNSTHLGELRNLLTLSIVALVALGALYVIVLWWALPWLVAVVLGPDYDRVRQLVLPWGLYFILYTVHLVGSAVLLTCDRYSMLLGAALSSVVVLLLALLIWLPLLGMPGAVLALITVELYNLVLLGVWFLPKVWRSLRADAARVS